jgi:outer membrane protein OmpA-like peptidoglycan-associated protein
MEKTMKKLIMPTILLWLIFSASLVLAQTEDLRVGGPPSAAKLSYQALEEGKLMVSVTDAQDKALLGLGQDDFSIRRGLKTATILSVAPLSTNKEVGLQIVLVVDNSTSMKLRKAIAPLLSALEGFYRTLRPIDTVTAVVFDEGATITVDGKPLHAKVMQTNDVDTLRQFVKESMAHGLTAGTYLHDAMMAGLDVARRMEPGGQRFLVVFSDGEDINSSVKPNEIKQAAMSIENVAVLAVDYMPKGGIDPFLDEISSRNGGRALKASSAAELLPVFEAFSSIMLHRYVVAYRFLEPPKGSLAFGSPELTIEEVTTIDSSPLLNHIYFASGQSELSDRYLLFDRPALTEQFDEKHLKGAMEKYRNVLNIIGRRLQTHPEATIRLVGCNSGTGVEKGRADLSRSRAEAVRAYLRYMWGIASQRMTVEHRHLPATPSTNRIPEGQAENQRVEIYSDNDAILDTVNSAFVQKVCDVNQVRIIPSIESEAGIVDWQITLLCGTKEIKTIQGEGALPEEVAVPLDTVLLEDISTCDAIDLRMAATDNEANELNALESTALPVNYVQRSRQVSQVQGYKVKEQYALILFDYDSADIKSRNQVIVERIIARMHEVPDAMVSIVGHTDTIGAEEYNLKLSEKRSKAVYQSMGAMAFMTDRLYVAGVGPNSPLYDNELPEGRSLNRTVTVTLEYLQKD